MRIGVDEPPGVQNFSRCPARIPPARSSSSRSVMPSGASYWPGRGDVPGQREDAEPLDFSVPIAANQSAPSATIDGTLAIDSTLLITVGQAYSPATAGNGGLQPGQAAETLQRVEQRRLLAADVGAGPGVDDDVQVEPGAEDVLAEVAGRVRLRDRVLQPPDHVQHLAADVDERVVGPDRVRR